MMAETIGDDEPDPCDQTNLACLDHGLGSHQFLNISRRRQLKSGRWNQSVWLVVAVVWHHRGELVMGKAVTERKTQSSLVLRRRLQKVQIFLRSNKAGSRSGLGKSSRGMPVERRLGNQTAARRPLGLLLLLRLVSRAALFPQPANIVIISLFLLLVEFLPRQDRVPMPMGSHGGRGSGGKLAAAVYQRVAAIGPVDQPVHPMGGRVGLSLLISSLEFASRVGGRR